MCILQDTKINFKEVKNVKRVISAAIYQEIQFDNEQEFQNYILKLQKCNQEFILEQKIEFPDGKINIKIKVGS